MAQIKKTKSAPEIEVTGKKKIFRTPLCDILGTEYPIMLAGMGNIAGPTLAAAVSNAGGLGVLGATLLYPEELREWIHKTRKLTSKPFGVDILMPEAIPTGGGLESLEDKVPATHREFVEKLKRQFGVEDIKARHYPMTAEFAKSQFRVVLEEKVPFFAAGLGSPDWLVPEAHEAGVKVISLVGNVKNALRIKERGSDILIAQGHEAGGHTGRVATLPLVPQVVDAVAPTPVVAAGGIADGRGLVAALALGAIGVWVGTAFLATPEAYVDAVEMGLMPNEGAEINRQILVKSSEESTTISRIYSGKTARVIKNKMIELWEKAGIAALPMPYQNLIIADLEEGVEQKCMADYVRVLAGQITGMIKGVRSAKEVMEDIVDGAIKTMELLNKLNISRAKDK